MLLLFCCCVTVVLLLYYCYCDLTRVKTLPPGITHNRVVTKGVWLSAVLPTTGAQSHRKIFVVTTTIGSLVCYSYSKCV